MRIFTLILGLAVAFMGSLPSLAQRNFITGAAIQISEPSSVVYQAAIIILGLLIVITSAKRMWD